MTSLDFNNPSLRPSRDGTAEWRTCTTCGDEFVITHGEATFAREARVDLPDQCRWCRPTRREALAAQRRPAAGPIPDPHLGQDGISQTAPGPESLRRQRNAISPQGGTD